MSNLPATIDRDNAALPERYMSAKTALAECQRVDECKDWADKAAALASYAKQADDDSLYLMARRIQGRAVRRAGELLAQFQVENGIGRPPGNGTGSDTISQRSAAETAGMSKRQEVTARRVAEVPEDIFEAAIEGDAPPSVTALANLGRREEPKPEGFTKATQAIGHVKRFAEFCEENDPKYVAHGVFEDEAADLRAMVFKIDAWLDVFVTNLKG